VSVQEAIRSANAVLPGEPVDTAEDPRWQAIIAIGEFIESEPGEVWTFIRRWGGHVQEDLRDAIATCLLEHLLEHHFAVYFPYVEQAALADPLFGDTLLRCWPLGEVEHPENAGRFAALRERLGKCAREE
jgi:hypothetical protein